MSGRCPLCPRQRAAISTLLETLDDSFGPELHDELRQRSENIGRRHRLPHTAVDGILRTEWTPTPVVVYRSEHHHHHLVCSCGSTIEVGDHEVEAGRRRVT